MKARRVLKFVLPALLAVVFLAATASSAFAVVPASSLHVSAHTWKTFDFAVPASLVTSSAVDTAAVGTWVKNVVAVGIHQNLGNPTLKLNKKKKRLDYTGPKTEYKMYAAQQLLLRDAIVSAIPSASVTTTVTTIDFTGWVSVRKPKAKNFGQTILVVQSERRIYFYVNHSVAKTYRCAVGMRAYPTPNGTFHIGKKNPHPTWTNGYASWSMGMPAFIGPGPNNPLGTRAMYVYTGAGPKGGSDTGVRFHGVPPSENSSIGSAASHGCLRMHRKDVEDFYPRVKLGTLVYIIK